MDSDVNKIDEYDLNLKEKKVVIEQKQQQNYAAELKKYLNIEEVKSEKFERYLDLRDRIIERDGEKVLVLENLSNITPDLLRHLDVMEGRSINKVVIEKFDKRDLAKWRLEGREFNEYSMLEMKQILDKMEALVGDLRNNNELNRQDKAILVANRITNMTVYAHDDMTKEKSNKLSVRAEKRLRNLAGGTIDGKHVCLGYADMFNEAMNMLNIPSNLVTGYQYNHNKESYGGHAWNQVQLEDGNWYNLDITAMDVQNEQILDNSRKVNVSSHLLKSDKDFGVIGDLNELAKYQTLEEALISTKGKTHPLTPIGYIPLMTSKGQIIEHCEQSVSLMQQAKSVEKLEEYEASLLHQEELKQQPEKIKKIGFLQKIKNFFSRNKQETLALPEAFEQGKAKNEFLESLIVSNEDLLPMEQLQEQSKMLEKDELER